MGFYYGYIANDEGPVNPSVLQEAKEIGAKWRSRYASKASKNDEMISAKVINRHPNCVEAKPNNIIPESSIIDSVACTGGTLRIHFTKPRPDYVYFYVPSSVCQDLMSASHAETYYRQNIRSKGYRYEIVI